jgi:sugar phosphate isomerase/epimerase
MLARLSECGVQGVEVAPGKVAPWEQLTAADMANFRNRVEEHGLEITSFQAFLFGRPELQLLGDQKIFDAFCDHMNNVCKLASVAGAKILVFGAPKNRLLLDHSRESAHALAQDRLSELAKIAENYGVAVGLEAVPSAYGAEFIQSFHQSLALVREVNRAGLVFHLDAGCTWMQNDDVGLAIQESDSEIAHFHISQPNLSDFSDPAPYHSLAAAALKQVGYDQWLCIEMLETDNPAHAITTSVNFVRELYLDR